MKVTAKEGCFDSWRKFFKKKPRFRGGFFLFILFCLAQAPPRAFARDMHGRFGIGYNAEFGSGIPAISAKYGLTRDLALEGVIGVATSSPAVTLTAVKFFKNVFYETNLNFYFMGGAGLLMMNNQAGMALLAGLGVEFFIPGIESLGLSVETGASFDNSSGSYVLKTLGVSFLGAGIHFYF